MIIVKFVFRRMRKYFMKEALDKTACIFFSTLDAVVFILARALGLFKALKRVAFVDFPARRVSFRSFGLSFLATFGSSR
jgi:hypothetical protein